MDSSTFIFPSSSVNILVYFNSECEHCQYELSEIRKNINLFEDNSIVLLSSENIASIKKTSFDFELANVPNVYFVKINPGDVYKTMGTVSFPHIFIYGKDHKLIKEFKGKAKIEAILKYIP